MTDSAVIQPPAYGQTGVVINVTRSEVMRSGTSNGRQWTLYLIEGTMPDGSALVRCKSFDGLALGPNAVDIELDRDPDWRIIKRVREGRKRTERPSGGDPDRIRELESRVAKLERQMRAIINNAEVPLP